MPRSRPQSILSLTYPSSFNETPAICLSNLSRTKHRTSNDSACYRHTMFPSYSRISVPLEIPFRKILLRSGDLEVRAIDLPGRFPDRRNSSNADIASSWNFIHSGPFTPFVIVPFFFHSNAFCQVNFSLLRDSMRRVGRADDHWIYRINGSVTERSLSWQVLSSDCSFIVVERRMQAPLESGSLRIPSASCLSMPPSRIPLMRSIAR